MDNMWNEDNAEYHWVCPKRKGGTKPSGKEVLHLEVGQDEEQAITTGWEVTWEVGEAWGYVHP